MKLLQPGDTVLWTSSDLTDKSKSYAMPVFGFKVVWAEIAQS